MFWMCCLSENQKGVEANKKKVHVLTFSNNFGRTIGIYNDCVCYDRVVVGFIGLGHFRHGWDLLLCDGDQGDDGRLSNRLILILGGLVPLWGRLHTLRVTL